MAFSKMNELGRVNFKASKCGDERVISTRGLAGEVAASTYGYYVDVYAYSND